LKSDVIDLMKEIKDHTEYQQRYASEIADCKLLTESLERISLASYSLKSCEEIVLGTDILAACQALSEMEAVMNRALPTEKKLLVTSGAVYQMLKREAKILRSRFTSRLRRLLQDFIQISRGRIVVHRVLSGILRSDNTLLSSELQLDDVLAALVLMGTSSSPGGGSNLEEIIANILQEVWSCVIYPLWREKKPLTPRINNTGGNSSEFVLEFTTATDVNPALNQLTDHDNGLRSLLPLLP
jgi:hypothetical protein